VPYIGYFTKQAAEKEARRIEAADSPRPDTWVRCVPAFSSLGWFSDPLYSSMLSGRDHHIVDLVVHESLHATVWVSGSVDFNEKLANFVGLEGSVRYMEKERGSDGAEQVRAEVRGEKVFADFMRDAVARYKGNVKNLEDKRAFYAELGARYLALVAERRKLDPKLQAPAVNLDHWNNAALLAYANYYSDYATLEKMLRACGGNLQRFVGWVAAVQKRGESAFTAAPEEYLGKLGVDCP
jgi:predicted aminopeptidase